MPATPKDPFPASRTPNGARPRAVALIGPQGSGKSTLFDALLTAAASTPGLMTT